jgi:Heparinase II/III-like protein/Heparinase II/III N-terminus
LLKLRKFSLDELQVRSSQKICALAERWGWSSLNRLPSDDAFLKLFQPGSQQHSPEDCLEHFRSRSHPRFFAAFDDAATTLVSLTTAWPDAKSTLLQRANRILEGKFDLLGFTDVFFGMPVDWHLDPQSGKRAPLTHWSQIRELSTENSGDKKILWELNRHQHFVLLGQAYWLTGDERFSQTFISHLESWMDQNPPKLGIHWLSSLEIAFRSISWIWGLHFFRKSPSLSAEVFWRALKFLYLNARHLENYLSTYFSPNTHLTGEALGLFYLGQLFPEFTEAARWRDTGRRILLEQLPIQVKADGVYFEHASYYHRYLTDFYIHFLLLARLNNETLPVEVERKLNALLDHLQYITRPDGTTPLFGDDDGGRLIFFDKPAPNDFRSTLAVGAALFLRGDYKFVAKQPAEEILWLLGPAGVRQFLELPASEPEKQSFAFSESGYYVMRDGWDEQANYLLFDAGPHGIWNCGHAHADALSFELASCGRTLLVDPGTYTYTGSREMRDWFRSSVAHNTLTIDDYSSSISDQPFSWKFVADIECSKWISRKRLDFVAGSHNGYQRLKIPVSHNREILFLKKDYWIVRDQVGCQDEAKADLWFHFEPGINPVIEADDRNTRLSERNSEAGLDIVVFDSNGKWRREEGWVSHCYGKREVAALYTYSSTIKGERDFITLLLPQIVKNGAEFRLVEVEAIGGRAFEVTHGNGLDIVMIRNERAGERVEMARMASDFAWTWVRFANPEDVTPEEMVLLQGKTLWLTGSPILTCGRVIECLVGRRVANEFLIDTGEGIFDSCSVQVPNLDSRLANLETWS